MRRVLGLVSWDAAAELKEKIKLAGLEAAHQLKKVFFACRIAIASSHGTDANR